MRKVADFLLLNALVVAFAAAVCLVYAIAAELIGPDRFDSDSGILVWIGVAAGAVAIVYYAAGRLHAWLERDRRARARRR